jgi:hypothetical protein
MRIDLDTDKYNVVIDSSNFDVSISDGAKLDVNIGESARIDVNSAVTYIKSGEKEIDNYVDSKVKPDILEYSKVESQKFIDSYVGSTVEEYVNNVTKPSIDEFANTKINDFDTNAVSKTNDFNTLSSSKIDEFNTLSNTLTGEYNSLAQTSEETLIQYVDSASLSAKNSKDSADVSTAQASISTAQAVISTTMASESLASANASANSAKQCQDIKDSFDETVDLSSYAKKTDLNTKQDKLTAGTGIKIENNVVSNTQTSAEWGNIKGTLSNQTDLQNALNGKVGKTGNDTINGLKAFVGEFRGKDISNQTIDLNSCVGSTSSATTYYFCSSNGGSTNITNKPTTNQDTFLLTTHIVRKFSETDQFIVQEYISNANSSIYYRTNRNGTWTGWKSLSLANSQGYLETVTPSAGDNSKKIATTQWVKNTIKTDAPMPTITYLD